MRHGAQRIARHEELDLTVGTFAAAELARMSEADLERFERFLTVGDPELQAWILAPAAGEGGSSPISFRPCANFMACPRLQGITGGKGRPLCLVWQVFDVRKSVSDERAN